MVLMGLPWVAAITDAIQFQGAETAAPPALTGVIRRNGPLDNPMLWQWLKE